MPCCAFAAFIVGQILIGLDAIKRFVLGGRASIGDLPDNPAAQWRLAAAGASNRTDSARGARPWRGRAGIRWIAVAASIEIALAAGAVWGVGAHLGHHHQMNASAHHHMIVSVHGVAHPATTGNPAPRN
jgi:hypothetical protein